MVTKKARLDMLRAYYVNKVKHILRTFVKVRFLHKYFLLHSVVTSTPFSYLLLLFLGLPFVFRFDRSSARGGVAWGMLLALSYFVVDLVFRDLGGRGALSPFLGGWGALLLLGSFGFTLKRQF